MIEIPTHLVTIGSSFQQTYQPVLDFHGWKIAMLRYFHVVAPETFYRVERHCNTNEVFILTAGQADLIVFDGSNHPTDGIVFPMRQHVAYDIQQSVWHHVVMSPDAHIVLFERSETGPETTEYQVLAADVVAGLRAQFTVKPARST